MADIKICKNHHIEESELRHQLEELADDMAKKFGIRADFRDNKVRLSGRPIKRGEVVWTNDTLQVKLTFDLMGKLFKKPIQSEIETKIESMVA